MKNNLTVVLLLVVALGVMVSGCGPTRITSPFPDMEMNVFRNDYFSVLYPVGYFVYSGLDVSRGRFS